MRPAPTTPTRPRAALSRPVNGYGLAVDAVRFPRLAPRPRWEWPVVLVMTLVLGAADATMRSRLHWPTLLLTTGALSCGVALRHSMSVWLEPTDRVPALVAAGRVRRRVPLDISTEVRVAHAEGLVLEARTRGTRRRVRVPLTARGDDATTVMLDPDLMRVLARTLEHCGARGAATIAGALREQADRTEAGGDEIVLFEASLLDVSRGWCRG